MTDWQVGDLATCVDFLRGEELPPGRTGGDSLDNRTIYRVVWLTTDYLGQLGLVLEGWRSDHDSGAYLASCFRKIRPDELDACETEFVDLLKRSKRTVTA